jgi:hypothetical protein
MALDYVLLTEFDKYIKNNIENSKKKDDVKENFETSNLWNVFYTFLYVLFVIFGFYMWYAYHFLVSNPDRNYLTIIYPIFFNTFYIFFNFLTDYTKSKQILANFGSLRFMKPI